MGDEGQNVEDAGKESLTKLKESAETTDTPSSNEAAVKDKDGESKDSGPENVEDAGKESQESAETTDTPSTSEAAKDKDGESKDSAPESSRTNGEKEGSSARESWADAADAAEAALASGVESDVGALDLSKATIDKGGTVDAPEMALKSEKLNEATEAPETVIEKVVVAADTPYSSAKSFEDLNLSPELLRGLYSEMKFEKPSRIQAETLPMILRPPYANLIAQAHNGSGKTTCFVLGMLSRVDPNLRAPQALCVCPTRELVIQNVEVLTKMGKHTGITCASTADEDRSVASSRRGKLVDQVVIGTPGTIKRWITYTKILEPKTVKILVFDEADHMLDQDGFQNDSLKIINCIERSNPRLQILLFSATFSEKVKKFAEGKVKNANRVFVPKETLSLDVIKQYCVVCPSKSAKTQVLTDRIFPQAEKLGQSIIFVRTRESARELHRQLDMEGHKCTSIHGGMEHSERDRVIREFRSGETKILISTDVLARGFDQAQVTLVVNYDIPTSIKWPHEPEYELYLHRIGRSGRFGRKGAAFNLVYGDADQVNLNKIERHFNKMIEPLDWESDDAFETALKNAGLA